MSAKKKPAKKKPGNRQRTSRGASWLRVAKFLRAEARILRQAWRRTKVDDPETQDLLTRASTLEVVALGHELEGQRLRKMP